MSEAYFKGDLALVFEAGRDAATRAIARDFSFHTRDSAGKAIMEAHALVSPHDDEATFKASLPQNDCTTEECGELLRQAVADAEAQFPKSSEAATAVALNPGQIALLRLIAGYAWKILGDYFNK